MEIDRTTKQLLKDWRKRRAWVKYQLLLKGRTLADIARDAEVERQSLYHAFARPYPRMERYIAEAIGLTPQKLFAERYDADGLPTRCKGAVNAKKSFHGGKDTRANKPRNTQLSRAA